MNWPNIFISQIFCFDLSNKEKKVLLQKKILWTSQTFFLIRSSKTTVRVCVCPPCVCPPCVCVPSVQNFTSNFYSPQPPLSPSFILLSPLMEFIPKIFCVMTSIFTAWEWIDTGTILGLYLDYFVTILGLFWDLSLSICLPSL